MNKTLILLVCFSSFNVCALADETSSSTTSTNSAPGAATSVSNTEVRSKHHGRKIKSTTTNVSTGSTPVTNSTSSTNTTESH